MYKAWDLICQLLFKVFFNLPKYHALSFPGTFKVVCRTFDHFVGGMKHLYEVSSCRNTTRAQQQRGAMRVYYIAAEEVEWDYASNKSSAPKIYNISSNEERYPKQKMLVGMGDTHSGGRILRHPFMKPASYLGDTLC